MEENNIENLNTIIEINPFYA